MLASQEEREDSLSSHEEFLEHSGDYCAEYGGQSPPVMGATIDHSPSWEADGISVYDRVATADEARARWEERDQEGA